MKLQYHLLALAVVAVWGVTFVSTKVLSGESRKYQYLPYEGIRV